MKHNNDYDKALSWLLKDSRISGLEKAEKLKSRIAKEGLIGVVVTKLDEMIGKNGERLLIGNKGAIVEKH
ncbi:4310_t:CDS:2 [Diversispora eburnea]|uniref:4310_t:CDS:1 n=1 Tax=Diversispora eburnea TaxID=1213867 RepID=A0A9N8VT69_9GLOM|nr:4310_t:CDS:2 [Diversispora eburnea]